MGMNPDGTPRLVRGARAAMIERFVDADGFHVRYIEHGEGPPLVYLHGGGGLRIAGRTSCWPSVSGDRPFETARTSARNEPPQPGPGGCAASGWSTSTCGAHRLAAP